MKENTKNARINVRSITFTAVMVALVFVFTLLSYFLAIKKLLWQQVSEQGLQTLSVDIQLG